MGIDDESSHPELCSEVAGGVTWTSVCLFREPDAGNLPVRFDEREQETEPSQTGLRWRGESYVEYPPGDYSHCACSRLYSPLHSSYERGCQQEILSPPLAGNQDVVICIQPCLLIRGAFIRGAFEVAAFDRRMVQRRCHPQWISPT